MFLKPGSPTELLSKIEVICHTITEIIIQKKGGWRRCRNIIISAYCVVKINRITDVVKIIIFAASVIIVCIMVAIAFKTVNDGKSAISSGNSQINNMASEYSEIGLSTYDNSMVPGTQVADFIMKKIDQDAELAIRVITKAGATTVYNRTVSGTEPDYVLSKTNAITTLQTLATEKDYINPSAQFKGKVYKNGNGVIVIVEFTQQ